MDIIHTFFVFHRFTENLVVDLGQTMSKPTYRLSVKYKDRSWNKTLRGSDWDKHYADITKFVTRRTGKTIDTECYVTVENKTLSSNDVFESLITNSNQSDPIELIVHVCIYLNFLIH